MHFSTGRDRTSIFYISADIHGAILANDNNLKQSYFQ